MIEKLEQFRVNRMYQARSMQRQVDVEEHLLRLTRKVNELVEAHNAREADGVDRAKGIG